ncbi:MFS transporter [Candidatus Frankia alpina]|uniref:MFS transporter n=1 Tax=Candidatus Frankia alpina TaxID=2699483 RepID=UPI001968758D|nr:MFS transporter [Candidatus Frankia alpina]
MGRTRGAGLGLSAVALAGSTLVRGPAATGVMFALAGAGGGSVAAASGRVVLGWFDARQRGLAMGIRQTSTPLGMALSALTFPPLASHYGIPAALAFVAVLTGLVAVLVAAFLLNPPRAAVRPARRGSASPYRDATLWQLHGASALLVWPQITVGAFGVVLLGDVYQWRPTAAGQFMAAKQGTRRYHRHRCRTLVRPDR